MNKFQSKIVPLIIIDFILGFAVMWTRGSFDKTKGLVYFPFFLFELFVFGSLFIEHVFFKGSESSGNNDTIMISIGLLIFILLALETTKYLRKK